MWSESVKCSVVIFASITLYGMNNVLVTFNKNSSCMENRLAKRQLKVLSAKSYGKK